MTGRYFCPDSSPGLNRKHTRAKNYTGMFPMTDKERKRSYLLPGMGNRAARRKQKIILTCSALIGLGISMILAVLLYWLNRMSP